MKYNKEILNRFLTGEVAIAVRTSEEWDKFMCLLEEETSVKWKAGEYPRGFNDWYIYGCNTAISCSRLKKTKLQFASTNFYKKADVEIIEFTELIKAELGIVIEDNIEGKGVYKVQDLIHSPNHYIGNNGLEVEEVLRNFIPRYENSYVAHRVASALEYLLRAPMKNGKQDLEKARYNLDQAITFLEDIEKLYD